MIFADDLRTALEGHLEERADLSQKTSVRIGGQAEFFASPRNLLALRKALQTCTQYNVPYCVMGGGTNALVSDIGVKGVVFHLGRAFLFRGNDELVIDSVDCRSRICFTLSAGQPLSRLVSAAQASGCIGMESLAGIPGTVGGAITMNAGTKRGSVANACIEIGLCQPDGVSTISASEIGFDYRSTNLPKNSLVVWAKFGFEIGTSEQTDASRKAINSDLVRRRETQPLDYPNFGSVFRNPPSDSAGRLIEACGLKGLQKNGAQISELHANFIVNRAGASASDILWLMRAAQEAVSEKFGVTLIPEVKLLGQFDSAQLPRGLAVSERTAA